MKNKFYVVFEIQPDYQHDSKFTPDRFFLQRLETCDTELAARQFIDKTTKGFWLTILEVWE